MTRTYNPDTEQQVTGTLETSENARHFWINTPEHGQVPTDNAEVAEYTFGLDGVRQGNLPDIQKYREQMRALVGTTVEAIIQETVEAPGTWRITEIVNSTGALAKSVKATPRDSLNGFSSACGIVDDRPNSDFEE